jgi:putative ABC transport system ATP-binding protein
MITLTRVTKTYSSGGGIIHALSEVTLQIPRGARVAVMGPSGSGKSTLLHLVGGLDRPTSGEVVVGQTPVHGLRGRGLAAHRRGIGFVFQRFNLIPTLNVIDNVIAPVIPYRTSFDKTARARELLDRVGLADRATTSPAQLSGGQQQRVAIARALVSEPFLILADEPTGALDSETGAQILDLILGLGTTTLIATHDTAVAERCDRIIHTHDGALVQPPTGPTSRSNT